MFFTFILATCVDQAWFFSCFSPTGSTQGEHTEKSPSDEGFTELEPTLNGSTDEVEGPSSKIFSIGSKVQVLQQEGLGLSCLGQGDSQDKSLLCQTKGKLDDEEDEGVVQISSIEDGESIQSSSEIEKQGNMLNKPRNQEATETKDIQPKGTEELLSDVDDQTVSTPVDQSRKFSLQEALEVCGNIGPMRQNSNRPEEGDGINEEERRKKSYEAEVKSWLLERIQAPIEGGG